jgi:hypothetical protein
MAFDDYGKSVEAIVTNQEPARAGFKNQGPIWLWVKGSQCAQLNAIGNGRGILHLWRNDGRDSVSAHRSPMAFLPDLKRPEAIAQNIVGWLRGMDPSSDEIGYPSRVSTLPMAAA